MVDGISNLCGLFPKFRELGVGEKKKEIQNSDKYTSTMFDQQKYDKADMVVLGVVGSKDFKEFETKRITHIRIANPEYVPTQEHFDYPLWAIYGSVVVEGSIHKGNIKDLREQTKVVWGKQKPYILNGDQ